MATRKVKPETENLSSAIDSILRERKMNRNALINAIEAALISAYKKNYGRNSDVRVTFDGRDVEITAQKSVVEEVQDPHTEITLEEARPHRRANGEAGDRAAHARGRARRDLR